MDLVQIKFNYIHIYFSHIFINVFLIPKNNEETEVGKKKKKDFKKVCIRNKCVGEKFHLQHKLHFSYYTVLKCCNEIKDDQ